MQELRAKAETEATDNQFKPQINSRSEKLAHVKQAQNSIDGSKNCCVTERLYNDAFHRIEKNTKSMMSLRDIQT